MTFNSRNIMGVDRGGTPGLTWRWYCRLRQPDEREHTPCTNTAELHLSPMNCRECSRFNSGVLPVGCWWSWDVGRCQDPVSPCLPIEYVITSLRHSTCEYVHRHCSGAAKRSLEVVMLHRSTVRRNRIRKRDMSSCQMQY